MRFRLGDKVLFHKRNGHAQPLYPPIEGVVVRVHTNPFNQETTMTIRSDGLLYMRLMDDRDIALIEDTK